MEGTETANVLLLDGCNYAYTIATAAQAITLFLVEPFMVEHMFLKNFTPRLGIKTTLLTSRNLMLWKQHTPETKVLYCKTVNPLLEVADIAGLAEIAKDII
jgi:cystathionine beta-lyase/cystathionine gamma-synthase